MTVQVSKSGGIYIEISGDYTKLQSDLKQVDALAKAAGKDISDALSGALKPNEVARNATNLSKYLATAQRAAQATKADLSGMDAEFRKMGQTIGVAEKNLDGYVKMQRQMFQTQAQKAYLDNLKGVQRLTGLTDDEMNKLAKSMGGVGNEFSKAAKQGIGLSSMLSSLGGIGRIAGVAGVAALGAGAVGSVKESFDLAARYETLGVVVQQVGKVAGYSVVEIDKNVSALRRMGIAGIEARKTMTQLLQAQVDISQTPALARIAQDAAVIGGTDSSDAFERMVHGIQSAQTEVLRTIGINVNFEQSYAKLASQLGKTTAELTEQEKVQARTNSVIEAGVPIMGTYEAALSTVGKQIGSLTRLQNDFLTDIGKLPLEVFKATGIIGGYSSALDQMSRIALSSRAKLAGVSQTSLESEFATGGTQGGRDLVESVEAAKGEIKALENTLDALAAKGIDLSGVAEPFKKTRDEFFANQEELIRLERLLLALSDEDVDTSTIVARLEDVRRKTLDTSTEMQNLRSTIATVFSIATTRGSGASDDAHVQAYAKDIEKQLNSVETAYTKTASRAKELKIQAVKDQQASLQSLVAAGKLTAQEAATREKAFKSELESLNKSSNSTALASERTSYQAAEAARSAADSLKNLQLRYSEQVAQLDGNSLGAALARSQRDYETQLDAIAKKEAEISKNRSLWAKEGKLTGETLASLDEQQESLEQEKELLRQIKKANDELARRADLASTYRANMDYASLTGDLRAYYAEQVKSLELQMQSASEAEKRSLSEQKRIAEARANLDVGGMFETGMNEMAKNAQQGIIDFWEKTLPNSIGSAVNTLGVAFAQVGLGTKSVSESFAEMGKTIQSIFQQILSDFINMSIRMAMFGQSGSGGMLGGLVSGIGGLFTGGGADTSAAGTDLLKSNTVAFASANGNVFSAPALSAYSNSIVSKPTIFPFAKGVGLMGEAGAEAIMPLRRGSGGRLGVDASGIAAQQQAPQFNVIVNTPAGVGVAAQEQKQNGQGGFDMTILLEMVDKAMASGISSGRSKTAHAMNMRGI